MKKETNPSLKTQRVFSTKLLKKNSYLKKMITKVQGGYRTPNRLNQKIVTLIKIKILTIESKEKYLKSAREKKSSS